MLRSLRIENLVLIGEAELELGAGLNAITGETGAGKTILAQAIGLLLGAKGDAGAVGPGGARRTSRPSSSSPPGFFETRSSRRSPGSSGGRGRPRPRQARLRRRPDARLRLGPEHPARGCGGATERLLAMSGQFEQRRLARPAYQLEVLDAFRRAPGAGGERPARLACARAAAPPARRAGARAGAGEAPLAELHALVEDARGGPTGEED